LAHSAARDRKNPAPLEEIMDGALSATPGIPGFEPPRGSAADILKDAARQFGRRPALNFMGRRTSYAELDRLVERAAAGLQKLGIVRGTRVALCLPNTPFYVVMYHAILRAGGTIVNVNPLYTSREIAAQMFETKTSIIVSIDLAMIQDKIKPLADEGLFKRVIVCRMAAALPPVKAAAFRLLKRAELAHVPAGAPYVELAALLRGPASPGPVTIDPATDIAVLQSTGGTTGMLTHANITANLAQVRATMGETKMGEERILAVLPFFHVFAMTAVMNFGLSIGAELLLLPRPDVGAMMRLIAQRRPSVIAGVPTLFTALATAAEADRQADLSCVRHCISGGAPLPHEVLARFAKLCPAPIMEGYGLSETSPVVAFNRVGAARAGSVGQAIPGTSIEIREAAPPYAVLPQGARGEICVRGPQVMRGYFNRPEETGRTMVEGALRTGDLGYLDEDGYLFIVDRLKDLIICGGYNVYPRTIEEVAYQHPAVQDAIAIGVPDKYRGQSPKLFVTLRPGQAVSEAEMLSYLEANLNRIEVPRSVEIRETLPRTLVGKLSKKELVAEELAKAP
jgi:long-chain acyl-CoA synthetase